ncbi:hypothetical protein Tco_0468382 [Tanacetum coccineum]
MEGVDAGEGWKDRLSVCVRGLISRVEKGCYENGKEKLVSGGVQFGLKIMGIELRVRIGGIMSDVEGGVLLR